ncbi:MAG: hypothetical protein ACOCTK_03700 [Candidatus Saliniplasma sp.]
MLSSLPFMGTVSASDDDLKPQPEIDVYHQAPDGIHNYPDDRNATSGEATATAFEDTGEIDNYLSLSVNPRRVDTCEEETNVKISITGTGFSEMDTIRYSDGTTVNYEPHTVEFYVQQSDVEADLNLNTARNTGVNTDGDERRGTKDSTMAMAQITLGAASFLPVIGPAAGVGGLGLTLMDAMNDRNNGMKEYTLGTGEPYGEIGATYYVEEEYEDLYDNEGIYFGFSTEVLWTIPSDHRDEIHELEIGASIENEEASRYGSGTAYDYEDGAETDPITVTLKNAEIESVESEENTESANLIMLSTANGEKYWDDNIDVTIVDEPESFESSDESDIPQYVIPPIDVTVDWGDGDIDTVYDWEPYDYNIWITGDPTRTYHGEYIEKELSFSHTYDLDNLDYEPGDTPEFEITITAESPGGWEMSESYDISIEYIDNDDGGGSGGGGGGGTPPPGGVSPMGNETGIG